MQDRQSPAIELKKLRDKFIYVMKSTPRGRNAWKYETLSRLTKFLGKDHLLVEEFQKIDCSTVVKLRDASLSNDNAETSIPFIEATDIISAAIDELQISSKDEHMTLSRANQGSKEERDMDKKIFIVHGRNDVMKLEIQRFIEQVTGQETIVLANRPSGGRNLLDKLTEEIERSNFVIVIMTGDDKGRLASDEEESSRARQNVIFELGFCIAKLGKERVVILREKGVEIPSDCAGVVYISLQSDWKIGLVKELKEANIHVDFNRTL